MEDMASEQNILQKDPEPLKEIGHSNKAKKWPLVFMLAVLVISISTTIALSYQNYLLNQALKNSLDENNYLFNPTPTSPKLFENWEVYQNKEDGYSFNYPSDWELEISENEYSDKIYRIAKITYQNSFIWFYRDPFSQGMPCSEKISEEEILLDGIISDKTIYRDVFDEENCLETGSNNSENSDKSIVIQAIKDDIYYLIIAGYKSQDEIFFETIFNKVISSFKFLN